MPLTDLACKKAKPRLKAYKLFDNGGLHLEVSPKGHKWWRLKYRFHGVEKRLSFGVYPQVSLIEAREKREAAKKDIANEIDPSVTRKEDKLLAEYKASQTVELVAREWHEKTKEKWSDTYAEELLRRLEADIFPQLGGLPFSNLTPPILHKRLKEIENRSKDQAKRCRQIVGQFLRYAVVTGRAERDFTPDLRGAFEPIERKNFASITPDEIPDFIKEIDNPKHRSFPKTIIATKIMMHIFVRTSELIKMRRKELDIKGRMWNIPAERMKKRRPHFVPLSHQVIQLFLDLRLPDDPEAFVFSNIHHPKKPLSDGTILKAIGRMGYKGRMTGHGFRALAMTSLVERLGYERQIVRTQLSHLIADKTEQAYNRAEYKKERIKMMQDWSDYIDSLT